MDVLCESPDVRIVWGCGDGLVRVLCVCGGPTPVESRLLGANVVMRAMPKLLAQLDLRRDVVVCCICQNRECDT